MKIDFTKKSYRQLIQALKNHEYKFYTFEQWCEGKANGKYVILRHDVDLKAGHSQSIALIENSLEVCASYYFRVVPQSNQPHIIKGIAALGHEIGYHYEDLSLFKGDVTKALVHFEKQLTYFRTFYPVKTICMHGSPTSNIDNRDIWKGADYKSFGVIGEPYFDVNFNDVFYLTDTGRCWDGERFSRRDKVESSFDLSFHSTSDIIKAITHNQLPYKVMITTHPQRWTDNKLEWLQEYLFQSIKNTVKRLIIK